MYTVEHRRATPDWLLARGIVPQEVPMTVTARGVKVEFPTRPCMEGNCQRCISGRGGYQFRWVDSRWTPRAALDLGLTPQQLQVEMYTPWPRGVLPIPRDRMAAAGSSSSSSTSRPAGGTHAASAPEAWNLRAVPEPAFAAGPAPSTPAEEAPRRRRRNRKQ